jgi:REP element-mobilizing transposase RayT
MPRPARQDVPGIRHHVMNRGARREPVFHTDEDAARFLSLVDRFAPRMRVDVHAYALMPNHFHLLVTSQDGRLSDFVGGVLGAYSRWANRRPLHDGPVWRGRYKSVPVTDDAHWEYLFAYVHLNPVRAGLVATEAEARHTSWDGYAHRGRALPCLETDEFLGLFGGFDAMRRYVDEVRTKRRAPPAGFDEANLFRVPPSQPTVVPPRTAPVHRSPEEALRDVIRVTGVEPASLFAYKRHVPNRAAWLAAWWLQSAAGLTQREVAQRIGTSQPGVAQRMKQFAAHQYEEPLKGWIAALRD